MDTVTAALGSALVVAVFAVLLGWVFVHSYRRNTLLVHRPPQVAVVTALLAVVFWPVTLAWWAVGPTPERRLRRQH